MESLSGRPDLTPRTMASTALGSSSRKRLWNFLRAPAEVQLGQQVAAGNAEDDGEQERHLEQEADDDDDDADDDLVADEGRCA